MPILAVSILVVAVALLLALLLVLLPAFALHLLLRLIARPSSRRPPAARTRDERVPAPASPSARPDSGAFEVLRVVS